MRFTRCTFGLHRWIYTTPEDRRCACCDVHEWLDEDELCECNPTVWIRIEYPLPNEPEAKSPSEDGLAQSAMFALGSIILPGS